MTTGSVGFSIQEKKVPIIVVFKDRPGQYERQSIEGMGGAVSYEYSLINAMAIEVPQHVYEKLVYMQNNPDDPKNPGIAKRIKYVELDQEVHIAAKPPKATPTPVPESTPWGVDRIDAPDVWASTTGTGVKVAVIDTGIDYTHPDLAGNVMGGVTFVKGTRTYKDDNGHGTHCAGIIAAVDNDIGVVGVAPGASLYGVKVLDRSGSGTLTNVIKGIDWAANNGMQVISMSLSTGTYSQALEEACNNAYAKNIVLVAAAGNDYGGPVGYPAAYDSVIAVTATDSSDAVASFSNIGSAAELAGPGVSILSTYKGGGYATLSGTSMSTPHVAGTAALIIADGITDAASVRTQLDNTAIDLGTDGRDVYYGFGLVNAYAATA